MCVDSAYYDISKAFDTVRDDLDFSMKLFEIGIGDPLLNWIIIHLQNYMQKLHRNVKHEEE